MSIKRIIQGKRIINNLSKVCAILNQETVSGRQFYAEYIYNAFALAHNKYKIAIFLECNYNLAGL